MKLNRGDAARLLINVLKKRKEKNTLAISNMIHYLEAGRGTESEREGTVSRGRIPINGLRVR